MGNPFDGLQNKLFKTASKFFGYTAEWLPTAGGALQTAKVLYKKPNEVRVLDTAFEYNPENHMMEYQEGDFVGLYESVREGAKEFVEVEGTRFYVEGVKAYWDGKTLRAELSIVV